jgi:hypothetical protein
MSSLFDRLPWFGPGDRRQLRRELRAVQEASIDEFAGWWSSHVGDRVDVAFERRGLRLLARERDAPSSSAHVLYDLASTAPHWQRRTREVVGRLSATDLSLPALETGPVFGLETNAWPQRVDDAGYLVVVNQGWIQLGYWIAQALAVTDAGSDDESAARAERILRSLPRAAADVFFDDSLALDQWLPDPLPVEDFDVEASEIQSYVAQGEAFILLHELAHILHGHLDQLEDLQASDARAAEVAAFRRACELEADETGTTLLVAAAPDRRVDEWALGLVFWLIHTADEYSVLRFTDTAERSHPRATDRLRTVLRTLAATQELRWDPEQLVELVRSLEPLDLELETKDEADVGPWRIRRLRLRYEEVAEQ